MPPQFCHNNKKAQKYLLGGFECVVKLHQVQLLPRVPIILKDLYDADLLEEDVIFAWAEKVSRQRGWLARWNRGMRQRGAEQQQQQIEVF